MNWSAEELRQLRYRMGWSQAEMARTLQLELTDISSWESGQAIPQETAKAKLISILQQAESNCERMQRRPIAEVIMRARGLSQIHDFEVVASLTPPVPADVRRLGFTTYDV